MENTEFDNQSRAYSNYVSYFNPDLKWITTIYKDLYDILDKNLGLTTVSLGDYFLERFIKNLSENLVRIENEVNNYAQSNNFNDIQKEHIFYYKIFLENSIDELLEGYKHKKKYKIKEEKEITLHDKILKELQVIDIIFKSQLNPELHLGSGIGPARYCNEIFMYSDVELFKIGSYKIEYASRLENSNNRLLLLNELANIYNKSIELYNYYVLNLSNHPNKKEIFTGKDAKQQIIDSTGHYNFINYRASFCFFGVELNDISSTFLKNNFSYRCKNETLVNFCVQLLEFIKLSGLLVEDKTVLRQMGNLHSDIFVGNDNKAFNLFDEFAKEITDHYQDYSFIFQKMKSKSENLINNRVRHKEFMDWLLNNNYIKESHYHCFIEKENFSTKYDRGMRQTRYYNIKEKYFSDNSD